MQQWWQREIVAATWSINKEKRIQQQKKQRHGVLQGSCHLYCVRWTRPVRLEHGWSWLRTSNLGFRQHGCKKCICVCILVYCIVVWSRKEQHGPWSWIVGVGISVFSSANYQLRIHSIGAGPSEDVLKGLCIGASLHIFTSHMYSDIDIVNVNHILIWRRQMVFPKEVRRCWALMSQTSQISIDPSFWIATLLTISCSLTAWLLRANLDPETATTSDWSKNWRWIVPNGSSSDHLCSLISVPKWDASGCPALEGCGSTGGGEQHLHYCRALGAATGKKNMKIWNNLSLLHFTDATKAHLSSEILPPSPVRCHPPWTGMNPWRLGMALYFFSLNLMGSIWSICQNSVLACWHGTPHTSNMVFECVEFLQLIGVILRIQLFGLTDSSLPVRVARTGTAVQMKPVASFFLDFLQRELLTIIS